jgi:hypothetical protein
MVGELTDGHSPSNKLVVGSFLGAPPPPLVAPPSLIHSTHDSRLCFSSEPPPLVVSASHSRPAPHATSASCCQPAPPLVASTSCQPAPLILTRQVDCHIVAASSVVIVVLPSQPKCPPNLPPPHFVQKIVKHLQHLSTIRRHEPPWPSWAAGGCLPPPLARITDASSKSSGVGIPITFVIVVVVVNNAIANAAPSQATSAAAAAAVRSSRRMQVTQSAPALPTTASYC